MGNVKASGGVNEAVFDFAPEVFGDGDVGLKRTFDGMSRMSWLFAYQTSDFAVTNAHDAVRFGWAVEVVGGPIMRTATYKAYFSDGGAVFGDVA